MRPEMESTADLPYPGDVMRGWRDDLVTFVLGCSRSFEQALVEAGLRLQHAERGTAVPMFRTDVPTQPAGRFHGPLVVCRSASR
jgi:uncharacterized protein YcsI (UPF0317 family)